MCTEEEVPLPSIGWRDKKQMLCGSMAVDGPQGRGNTFRLSHSPSWASVLPYVASAYCQLFLPCCCLLCHMYLMIGPFNQPFVTASTTVPVIICWLYLIIYHLQLKNSDDIF